MNEDEKEMLELAAKAVNISLDVSGKNGGKKGDAFDLLGNVVLDWHNNITWNPLKDDGDAFRLMVKLKIAPDFSFACKEVPAYVVANFPKKYSRLANGGKCWVTAEYVPEEMWLGGQDDQKFADWYMTNYPGVVRGINSAARQAIVRAAAEIGRQMK